MSSNVSALKPSPAKDSGLRDEWRTGQYGLPVARYIDKEFAKLEAEMLWPHVWQMAARLDQFPNPGDFVVYEILDQSIILVRTGDDVVKAFHNVCPHRATALALGSGRFQLETIVCPFHGWKWNLDGKSTFVLDREEFKGGCLTDEDVALKAVKVEVWAGSAWINLDPDARPLAEHMAPVKDTVEALLFDKMKFHWHQTTTANANWKVAQEAFMEAYHVAQTHPQLARGRTMEAYSAMFQYERLPKGHGLFTAGGIASAGRMSREELLKLSQSEQVDAVIRSLLVNYEGQDGNIQREDVELARTMRYRKIPEGKTVAEHFLEVIREHYGNQGRPIPTVQVLAAVTDMHIFPHIVFLPSHGNLLMYRFRPRPDNDPDWCVFDMYAFRTYPDGQEPPKWSTQVCESLDDFATIPSQDFFSIPRVQKGLHSRGISHTLMGSRQEELIFSMHTELDVYLETGRGS